MDSSGLNEQQHKKHKKLRKNIQKKRNLKKQSKEKRKLRKARIEQNSMNLKKIHFHVEGIKKMKTKSKLATYFLFYLQTLVILM
jgi:hypothetical protein